MHGFTLRYRIKFQILELTLLCSGTAPLLLVFGSQHEARATWSRQAHSDAALKVEQGNIKWVIPGLSPSRPGPGEDIGDVTTWAAFSLDSVVRYRLLDALLSRATALRILPAPMNLP